MQGFQVSQRDDSKMAVASHLLRDTWEGGRQVCPRFRCLSCALGSCVCEQSVMEKHIGFTMERLDALVVTAWFAEARNLALNPYSSICCQQDLSCF